MASVSAVMKKTPATKDSPFTALALWRKRKITSASTECCRQPGHLSFITEQLHGGRHLEAGKSNV